MCSVYLATSATASPSSSSTEPRTTTTAPLSTYSGTLSASSPLFIRPYGDAGYYYFQAIQVTVFTNGAYIFTSYSSINIFGYLYDSRVDPSSPQENLIVYNYGGNGGRPFRIEAILDSWRTYVLLVTTNYPMDIGSFWIRVSGPALIDMNSITLPTRRPIITSKWF